jgi:hypothetical protein
MENMYNIRFVIDNFQSYAMINSSIRSLAQVLFPLFVYSHSSSLPHTHSLSLSLSLSLSHSHSLTHSLTFTHTHTHTHTHTPSLSLSLSLSLTFLFLFTHNDCSSHSICLMICVVLRCGESDSRTRFQ